MLKSFLINRLGSWPFKNMALALSKKQPLVTLYHGVTTNINPLGSENYRRKHIPVEAFEHQIKWLKKHFNIVPLSEIEDLVLRHAEPKNPVCAITFDDGYENNYANAFPILKKEGIPATIFLTTDFINNKSSLWPDILEYAINKSAIPEIKITWPDQVLRYKVDSKKNKIDSDSQIRENLKKLLDSDRQKIIGSILEQASIDLKDKIDDEPDYRPLTWLQIKEMVKNNISFGAHTVHHPILSKTTADRQKSEILNSKLEIENGAGQCRYFAYPNGQLSDWNDETEIIIKELGFRTSWTTLMGRININKYPNPLTLPRITMDASHLNKRFEALASNALPWIKSKI